ncbi:MAG: pentapeptide repeat-containing protein [Deltaproteobacteria bacterium]|nr:pentapeptide repeat-containing protein [Deltaproteobacteria bacterium]
MDMKKPSAEIQAALDASRLFFESYAATPAGGKTPGAEVSWGMQAFEAVDLRGAVLVGADLLETRLANCWLDGALIWNATGGGSVWDGSSLRAAEFNKAELIEASFRDAKLEGASFVAADLVRATFAGAQAPRANFARAHLLSADLGKTDLSGANLTRALLTGANLAGAQLSGAILTGAVLDHETRLSGCQGLETVQLDYIVVNGSRVEGAAARAFLLGRAADG